MAFDKKPQTVKREDNGDFKELKVYQPNRTPSWKLYGEGSAEFRAQTHINGEWLQLSLGEYSFGDKRTTARETTLALDKESAIALRDLLNEAFPKNHF